MTYEEYANIRLEDGGMNCRLPHQLTIRGQGEDSWGSNQFDDDREPKDASKITGAATLIHSSYHEGGWAHFNNVARCGDYIYIADWERIPEYDWWYYIEHPDIENDSMYYAHVIEYCISTGITVDMNLGTSNIKGNPDGLYGQIYIIEERKILYWEGYRDNDTVPQGNYIRILDFSTQTIEKILFIEDNPSPTFSRFIWDICTIRDDNDEIHLCVMCEFSDDTKLYAAPNGYNLPGAAGFTIYHKNYTIDSQWQVLDVPLDTQDTDVSSWDKRFDIIDNRYLVIFGYREEGEGYGPVFLVHVVFDVITCAPPIEYDLQSPWGESWWDGILTMFSSPDFTNGKLYESISQYPGEDDIVDMSFDPTTGEFTQGTIYWHFPPVWRLYPMSSREHAYFWSEDDKNFYLASTDEILGNFSLEYEANAPTPYSTHEGVNISFLLDSNGGGNPLVWYWSYSGSTLRGVDIITGSIVFDMFPTGFVPLNGYTMHLLHMGDSLLLTTEDEVIYPHGDPPTSWSIGCTQVDYYLIT